MRTQFNQDQFTHTRQNWRDHYVAEASDLRLEPGVWPRSFRIIGVDVFYYTGDQSRDGAHYYLTADVAMSATIFND